LKNGNLEVVALHLGEKVGQLPFMVGAAAVSLSSQLVIIGGGATCFSMGTFWDTGVYRIDLGEASSEAYAISPINKTPVAISYQDSPKLTHPTTSIGQSSQRPKPSVTSIPRVKIQTKSDFAELVQKRKPVIIEGLDLGGCVDKWNPEYMVQSVGETKEVPSVRSYSFKFID
jgi:tRNA wybutosine-synthesizing protein 4